MHIETKIQAFATTAEQIRLARLLKHHSDAKDAVANDEIREILRNMNRREKQFKIDNK